MLKRIQYEIQEFFLTLLATASQKWGKAIAGGVIGVGLIIDLWEWQSMLTEHYPVLAPFVKIGLVGIGSSLLVTSIASAILSWYKKKEEEGSLGSTFIRIATLASRIDRGRATTEEEQEYNEFFGSFARRIWLSKCDPKNYKQVYEEAMHRARHFF